MYHPFSTLGTAPHVLCFCLALSEVFYSLLLMPLMTLCKFPGCRKAIVFGERYCDAHKALGERRDAEQAKERERRRVLYKGSASKRGYTYKWSKAAKAFLTQHPLCVRCEAKGIVRAAEVVDHIIPHRGDQKLFWDASNWQALCKQCHDKKTATEDGGFGNKLER